MYEKHTLEDWGISLTNYNEEEWGTSVGSFKVPRSLIKRFETKVYTFDNKEHFFNNKEYLLTPVDTDKTDWNQSKTVLVSSNKKVYKYENNSWVDTGYLFTETQEKQFDPNRAFREIATTYMNAIVAQYDILRRVKFEFLHPNTQLFIRFAVYNAIEFSLLNKQVWENVNGSSISTPGFNIAVDSTNWLLTSDMIGKKAHNFLENSGMSKYSIVGDAGLSQLVYTSAEGNTILQTFNNSEFGKILNSTTNKTLAFTISSITSAEKYDYVTVKINNEHQIWRFEGGDFTDISNWSRKDTKEIGGNRYLVFDNMVFASSNGKDLDVSGLKPDQIIEGIQGDLTDVADFNKIKIEADDGSEKTLEDTITLGEQVLTKNSKTISDMKLSIQTIEKITFNSFNNMFVTHAKKVNEGDEIILWLGIEQTPYRIGIGELLGDDVYLSNHIVTLYDNLSNSTKLFALQSLNKNSNKLLFKPLDGGASIEEEHTDFNDPITIFRKP